MIDTAPTFEFPAIRSKKIIAAFDGGRMSAAPSEIWRQIFRIVAGCFVGVSALMRLAAPIPPEKT